MSTTTSRLGLYKSASDGSETVNVVTDLLNNWDKLDQAAGVQIVTSSTRPSTPYAGKLIAQSDTSYRTFFHNGTTPVSGGWIEIPNSAGTFGGNLSIGGNLTVAGVGQQLFVCKTSPQTSTSGSYANDSQLTVSLAAGATYVFDAFIAYATLAAAGMNMRFSYSGTLASGFWTAGAISGSSGTTTGTATLRADGASIGTGFALPGGNGSSSFLAARPRGIINTTTAGNLFFEWSQNSANATASTVNTNSWILAQRTA